MKKFLPLLFSILSLGAFAQSVTEIYYPLYVQGVGSGNPPDDRKVPFACRMQIDGLTPNAVYRYYSRFGNAPTGNTGSGFYILANQSGNFTRITSASLAAPGSYGQFTTNASGSATDWFIVEPSSAIDFAPGTQLWWRIFLNNGAGGSAVVTRITAPNPVTVLGWGSTASQGTGFRSTAISAYTAKNFMMFYDNVLGSGRPVAGTFIESDGTLNGSALNGDPFTAGYAPFYGDFVDGVDKTWGTIIPNNLANGIRNISEYSLVGGSRLNECVSSNGIYGATNTANATGGLTTPLVLTCTPVPVVPVSLVSFTVSVLANNKVDIQWATATEINAKYFDVEASSTGNAFSSIGRVQAKGDNSNYKMEDILKPGITYYRLKMVDIDGRFKYSQVVIVNGKQTNTMGVYPNPAIGNSIAVSHLKASTGSTIRLYSINGTKLASQNIVQGAIQSTIDTSKIPTGNYLVVFENEGKRETVIFQKN